MKKLIIYTSFIILIIIPGCDYFAAHNIIQGFSVTPHYDEQEKLIHLENDVRILINAPSVSEFDASLPVNLVIYVLPNGNTIEQTKGKLLKEGDDWHFDIQHIGAQTRFVRNKNNTENLVIVYLENKQKSWPAWKKQNENYAQKINGMIDSLKNMFNEYNPVVTLSGHSGGGSLIITFIENNEYIPDWIDRITFLDSNYSYKNEIGEKLIAWLQKSANNKLVTLAYNDSIALYKGKPFVSATGGTWYRSKMMIKNFSDYFDFLVTESEDLISYKSSNNQVLFILKKNPLRKIFHTEQVELNGFILCMLFGTKWENDGYEYFSNRAYQNLIR